MVSPDKISAIRQKTSVRSPPPEIAPVTAMSALGNSVVRAGEEIGGLVMTADDITEQRSVRAALTDLVPDHGLLALVEGPESRFGLFALDHELVAALIETQTIGRLLGPSAQERSATKTDATLCADFVDRVLECLEVDLAETQLPVAEAIAGYRFAVRLDDTRAASMALDDIPFRCFQASFKLGEGPRIGGFTLLLPFDTGPAHGHAASVTVTTAKNGFPEVVLNTPTELHAVLHQTQMSLVEVAGLEQGMVLTLPREALGAVSLIDLSGKRVALCRLGQAQGKRALRIGQHQAVAEDIDDNDADALPSPSVSQAFTNIIPHDNEGLEGGSEVDSSSQTAEDQAIDEPA